MTRVGLIGAGPWARSLHGPGLVASPDLDLTGLWARRAEAATDAAGELGVTAYPDFDALLDDVDAVAFAVAPVAQGEYGLRAALAGKHLILDKPLADDIESAQQLVDASTQVVSAVFFTTRYTPGGREFLRAAADRGPWSGAVATWVSGGVLDGPYSSSPWRQDDGALLDVGPHAVGMLTAALGPVQHVTHARRVEPDYVTLILEHDSGATSQVALSLRIPTVDGTSLRLFGPSGQLDLGPKGDGGEAYATMLAEFAAAVRGDGPPVTCDAAHALQIQQVLATADDLLTRRL